MSTLVQAIQETHDSKVYQQRTTTVVTFGGIDYYLDQAPVHVISFQPSKPADRLSNGLQQNLLPCTVINWSKDQLDKEDLDAISASFVLRDDVWTPAFLEVVILQTPQTSKICVAQDGASVLLKLEATQLLTGPYAIRPSTGEILHVSRLYEDDCSAFIGGSLTSSTQLHSSQWLITGVGKSDLTRADSLTLIRVV